MNNGKEYVVVSSTTYNNKKYVYLINPDDYTNIMFCEYDNNSGLKEIKDFALIQKLVPLFIKEIM
ncbi:MAG: hypothetical protein GX951_04475 [Mollicutes bacterium]|nr:hypothetical protein [Mollicutes bacterium]